MNRLWAEVIPSEVEIHAVLRLALHEGETEELEVHLIEPAMSAAHTLIEEIHAEPGPDHEPGHEVLVTHGVDFRFPVQREGIHSLELYTPRNRDSLFWLVRQGRPPGV